VNRTRIAGTAVAVGVAGAILGAVVAYTGSTSHRAATTLSVQRGGNPAIVPTVVALAQTSVLAENVSQAVHVPTATVARRLHARALAGTALLELTYDDPSASQAAQVAQQAASTLESLVVARFPALRVAVVDPAHPVSSAGRPVLRDMLIGALLGLLVGAALGSRRIRLPSLPKVPSLPKPSLPKPSLPKLPRLPKPPKRVPKPKPVPIPAPAEPEPEPAPLPEPEPVELGELGELRAALAAYGAEFRPDQVTEWEAFLDALEPHLVNGELPSSIAQVADEVFAPLRERLHRSEA
jgi:hypothetical protein